MSAYLYDKALWSKFKDVLSNTVFSRVEQHFEESSSMHDGEVMFPLIGLSRSGGVKLDTTQNRASRSYGRFQTERDANLAYKMVQGLPITIDYQIDLYGTSQQMADDLLSEVLFFLMNDPKVSYRPEVPSDIEWTSEDADLVINDVSEQTDGGSFPDRGRIYRTTLDVRLVNAVLMQVRPVSAIERVMIDFEDIDTEELLGQVDYTGGA